jgi:hypothetical protein
MIHFSPAKILAVSASATLAQEEGHGGDGEDQEQGM